MRVKVSVIGAGNVGATVAEKLAQYNFCDIVLVDIIEGLPEGKALDINHSSYVLGIESKITGSTDFSHIKNSEIVVITAGLPRKPGMTREDLINKNAQIVKDVVAKVKTLAPRSIIIMVTNPLDIMTYLAYKISGFPRNRVVGMSGMLDSTRFSYYIAEKLGVSPTNITCLVLGTHGDTMVPLERYVSVGGIPLVELLSQEEIEKLKKQTIEAGTVVVNYLKAGSAYYAPGACIAEMVEVIVFDKKKVLPASAILEGEYNLDGVALGVPIVLGRNGVEKIIQLKLTENEKQKLINAANTILAGIKVLNL
ncbi:MAG: malate dehydrogenase [Planctomycetota bacterium]